MPFYHYCTIEEEIEVMVSKINEKGEVIAHIEEPDEELGFKELEINILNKEILENNGFSEFEVLKYLKFIKNNFNLMLEISLKDEQKEM